MNKKIDNYFLQNKPKFILGAADKSQFYTKSSYNIAFIGRSNVGKSSLINALTNSKVSKTSKMPGRTREINFFEIDNNLVLVDMPGYGFANTSEVERKKWHNLIADYLSFDKKLKVLFLLLDVRRGITTVDFDFIQILKEFNILCQIVITKIDTVNKNDVEKTLEVVRLEVAKYSFIKNEILVVSSSKGYGVDKLRETIYDLTR